MNLQFARIKGLLDLQDTVAAGDHLQLRRVGKDKKRHKAKASGVQSKRPKVSKKSKEAVFASEASKHGLSKAEGVASIAKFVQDHEKQEKHDSSLFSQAQHNLSCAEGYERAVTCV
eukprot:jgi/Ulvmu1/1129/UM107_0002.1